MALFNYATKEITLKIVYYGPGLSGKTTNLQYLHSVLNPATRGKLLSLSTEADRTLFFDFLPVELGKIRDLSIRFQLYTVPGQVRYNATRKVVLKGADAVVFVADSQREMREQNMESFLNMRDNLFSNNINPDDIPIILQYNKRDLRDVAAVEELNQDLNRQEYPVVESSAISGHGVEESFNLITRLLLKHISQRHKIEIKPKDDSQEIRPPEYPPLPDIPQPALPEPEPISEESAAFSPTTLELPVAEQMPEAPVKSIKELSPIPAEMMNEVILEMRKINGALDGLRLSLAQLAGEMKVIERLEKEQGAGNATLREIAVLLKEQGAGNATLREIAALLKEGKTRKLKFW